MKKKEKNNIIGSDPTVITQSNLKNQNLVTLFIGILATLFLIALGGMVCSLLSLSVSAMVLSVWCGLCVGASLFFWKRPKYRLWFCIGGAVFIVAVALLGGALFSDGMALFFNGIKDIGGVIFSRIYMPYEVSGNYSESLATTVFLLPVALMFSVLVTYAFTAKGRGVLVLLSLCLLFALIPTVDFPFWVWFVLYVYGLTLLFIVRISGMVNMPLTTLLPMAGGIVAVVFVIVFLLGFAIGEPEEKPVFLAERESKVTEVADSFRWREDRTHNLPEGSFDEVDSFVRNDTAALEVTMSELSSLYLRGYVGTVYTESGWQETDKVTLYEYADLFYWLHEGGFYGTSQIALAADVAGAECDEISVTVKNLNANDRYIYTPYEYNENQEGTEFFRIGDTAPSVKDFEDPREYSYVMNSNLVRDSVKLAQAIDEKALRGDDEVIAYLTMENAYREYVYDTCLDIPEETETVLKSHLGEVNLEEGHSDYDDAMQSILNELLSSVSYNEEVGEYNGNTDFVREFLETDAEGYSVHYATTAAMIFRYYGIPSRYVEGFAVIPENLFGLDDGATVTLTGENAHAWVEYYRDGVGWIPFEVTPPYLFIMELPESMNSYVSDHLDSLSNQTGMLNMDEDNFEEEEEEESKEDEKESSLSILQILAIVGGVLFLLLIVGAVVLILRRKRALERRTRAIAAADDRKAVDMVLCDCLEILYAVGLKRTNGSLEQCAEALAVDADPALGHLTAMMIELHREALFSDHEISPDRRRVFELFRGLVIDYAKERSSLGKQCVHRYLQNLY